MSARRPHLRTKTHGAGTNGSGDLRRRSISKKLRQDLRLVTSRRLPRSWSLELLFQVFWKLFLWQPLWISMLGGRLVLSYMYRFPCQEGGQHLVLFPEL